MAIIAWLVMLVSASRLLPVTTVCVRQTGHVMWHVNVVGVQGVVEAAAAEVTVEEACT